ncbi:MAG TPA: aspartate/glutamate racemase family protein [Candidatus Coprocola pullicola]|nr:aspartate/glutamate racemase family protein [Candidatus Coprocola pullicola]
MQNGYSSVRCEADIQKTYTVKDLRYIAGHSIGIIAVDLKYPKLPGNVVNATTYPFPVLYKKVEFKIEQLFEGDETLKQTIIDAAKQLQKEGVRAVVGACGFFANFQKDVADALEIPAFLSSMIQLPMIKTGLKTGKKIGIITASGNDITDKMLLEMGVQPQDCYIEDIGSKEGFQTIRYEYEYLDNESVSKTVVDAAKNLVEKHDDVGAILLECSDIPPYAYMVQEAVGLPVFDFITMINWAHHATTQKPYFGYF